MRPDRRALAPVLAANALALLVLLAVATGAADHVGPRGGRRGEVLMVVGVIALGLAIVGMIASGVRQLIAGPARFAVLPGVGYRAGAPRWYGWVVAAQALGFGAYAAGFAVVTRTWPHPPVSAFTLAWIMVGLQVAVAALQALGVGRAPAVLLTPDALVLRRPVGTTIVPWPALAPIQPLPGRTRARIAVARRDLVTRTGWSPGDFTIRQVDANLRFVMDAVLFYVGHPESRAGIGTDEGYRALLAALGVAAGDSLPTSDRPIPMR